jgi:hypothetical protein
VSDAMSLGRESAELSGTVRLRVRQVARVDLDRVAGALGGPEASWLGERAPDASPGVRRFYCDLELQVSPARWAVFRKSAIVGLGEPRPDHEGWVVPIEWRAATLAPLFPVFAGHLRLRADRIELAGRYAPPGGAVGYVLDRTLLGVAARGTGRWLLGRVAAALSEDAAREGQR